MSLLNGLRILDLSTVLMGPYGSQILGDYGADVIKVEAPEGDVVRQIGPTRNAAMGPLFLNVNRSKRDISLDLKRPESRDAILRLLKSSRCINHQYSAPRNGPPRLVLRRSG